MDLKDLLSFIAVATERNFTRAAEQLGISQPPLSRQIKELEAELGLQLFDRNMRPIKLTNAGRMLLEHSHRVVGAFAQLEEAMRRLKQGERHQFVFGFVGSTIYGPIPNMIRRFRDTALNLDIDLIEMSTRNQIEALKEGRIDAGLGRLTFDDPAVKRRVIEHEPLVVAMPNGHPFAQATAPLRLEELIDETIILYPSQPRPSYVDHVLGIFQDYALHPHKVREVRELQAALGLVAAQFGITLVPASIQKLWQEDLISRAVAESGATSPIILNWRANDQSPAITALLAICAELEVFTTMNEAPGRRTERHWDTTADAGGDRS